MEEILARIRKFRDDRDFKQFHSPENLAKSINIEAGELLEHFQWGGEFDKEMVGEELADVMVYCLFMADALGVDYKEIIMNKMSKNENKYPVEKARGTSKKYTKL